VRCLGAVVERAEEGTGEVEEAVKAWVRLGMRTAWSTADVRVAGRVAQEMAGTAARAKWARDEARARLDKIEMADEAGRNEALLLASVLCRAEVVHSGKAPLGDEIAATTQMLIKILTLLVIKRSADEIVTLVGALWWVHRSQDEFTSHARPIMERFLLREKAAVVANAARFLSLWKGIRTDEDLSTLWCPVVVTSLKLVGSNMTPDKAAELVAQIGSKIETAAAASELIHHVLECVSSKSLGVEVRAAAVLSLKTVAQSCQDKPVVLDELRDHLQKWIRDHPKETEESRQGINELLFSLTLFRNHPLHGDVTTWFRQCLLGSHGEKARRVSCLYLAQEVLYHRSHANTLPDFLLEQSIRISEAKNIRLDELALATVLILVELFSCSSDSRVSLDRAKSLIHNLVDALGKASTAAIEELNKIIYFAAIVVLWQADKIELSDESARDVLAPILSRVLLAESSTMLDHQDVQVLFDMVPSRTVRIVLDSAITNSRYNLQNKGTESSNRNPLWPYLIAGCSDPIIVPPSFVLLHSPHLNRSFLRKLMKTAPFRTMDDVLLSYISQGIANTRSLLFTDAVRTYARAFSRRVPSLVESLRDIASANELSSMKSTDFEDMERLRAFDETNVKVGPRHSQSLSGDIPLRGLTLLCCTI